MKRLRILNGTHAGASLDLAEGRYSLGREDGCDIAVTDWRFDALSLHVGQRGVVMVQWQGGGRRIDDLAALDFDGIAICVGPSKGAWPSDAQLRSVAQPALAAGAAVVPEAPRRRHAMSGMAVAVVALACAGWLMSPSSQSQEAPRPTLEVVRASLQRTADTAAAGRLRVSVEQGSLLIEGLLDTPEQARAAAASIAAQGSPFPLVQRVSVASDVAETIRSAVGLPGARITYQGQGVFSFAVKSSDVAATQAMLDRVRADLAPVVRRIDAVLEEPPAKMPAMSPVLSALSAEGVSVMETRDGMKHLVMAEPAIEEPLLPGESRPSGLAPSRMGSAPHQESPP